jgi:hypothetical protein
MVFVDVALREAYKILLKIIIFFIFAIYVFT